MALLAFPDGNNGISRVWIRTGRVERVDGGDTTWTSVTPSIEAIQLRTFDVATLGEFPRALALAPDAWPTGDLSVFPEDIRYTRDGGILHVHAVVRNGGNAEARDVQILFGTTTTCTDKGPGRLFVRSVPARDVLELTADLPFNAAHGAVFVQALQVSEHTTIERWYSDPTPDDGAAFRIVSAELAPAGYAEKLRGMCGGLCRGF